MELVAFGSEIVVVDVADGFPYVISHMFNMDFHRIHDVESPAFGISVWKVISSDDTIAPDRNGLIKMIDKPAFGARTDPFITRASRILHTAKRPFLSTITPILQIVRHLDHGRVLLNLQGQESVKS